jgi:hypothetical protein
MMEYVRIARKGGKGREVVKKEGFRKDNSRRSSKVSINKSWDPIGTSDKLGVNGNSRMDQ